MRTEKWYHSKLTKYFYDNYGEYEYDSEWFVNPAPNKFKCYISKLGVTIIFTCDEDGNVTEEKEYIEMDKNKLYDVIEAASRGCNGIYEDHIIQLIGRKGFDILRENELLEKRCVIDERQLYILAKN